MLNQSYNYAIMQQQHRFLQSMQPSGPFCMQRGEIPFQGKSTIFTVDTVCSSLDEAPQGTNLGQDPHWCLCYRRQVTREGETTGIAGNKQCSQSGCSLNYSTYTLIQLTALKHCFSLSPNVLYVISGKIKWGQKRAQWKRSKNNRMFSTLNPSQNMPECSLI